MVISVRIKTYASFQQSGKEFLKNIMTVRNFTLFNTLLRKVPRMRSNRPIGEELLVTKN